MDELLKRIVVNPKVMVGKPVIRGTRLTVEHILKELANGLTFRDLIDAYPRLAEDDVRAACAYAAARLSEERILIDVELMRILADENCDRLLVAALRSAGHDVTWVAEWGGGDNDGELVGRANAEQRIILTNDRDFGLLAERAADRPPAIILTRLDRLPRAIRATHGRGHDAPG